MLDRIPNSLDVSKGPTEWKRCKQNYEIYACANELEKKSSKVKIANFLYAIGEDAVYIYNSFYIEQKYDKDNKESELKIETIMEKFDSHFIPKVNTTYERYCFFKRQQLIDENIVSYYSCIKILAKSCSFKDMKESLIRDKIIIGMNDETLRQRFLQESCSKELTAEQIVESCKMKQISRQQNEEITRNPTIEYVKTDFKKKEYKKEFKNKDYEYKKPAERKTCGKCGRTHEFGNCPAYKSKCHKCNKEGHWEKLCRKPSERAYTNTYENYEVNTSIDTKKPTGNYKFLGEIKVPDIKSWTKLIKVKAPGFNQTCEFKIDTGTSATILPYNRKLPKLIKSNIELRGPGIVPLEIVGMFTVEMTYKESTIRENIYVLKNQHIGLLSRNMSIKLGLIKLIGEVHPHKEVFERLGKLKRKYKIQINRNVKPYSIYVPRPVPIHLQARIKEVAERAVKTIKSILEKEEDPNLGQPSYRSTPLSLGRSPAERLMNRKLRTTVVDLKLDNYMNKEDHCIFRDKNENKKLEIKRNRYNKYTKNLRKIEDGEDVYIRDLDRMATVINTTPESTRSYNLRTEKQDVRMNRCQLIPTNGST